MIPMIPRLEHIYQMIERGKGQLFQLKVGQILRGQVINILNETQAIVQIQGTKMLARMEVQLTKGQQAFFRVMSIGNEIKLKVLTDPTPSSKPITSSEELLQLLNIKNSPENRGLLLKLLDNQLPIEKGIFDEISKILKMMKQNEDTDVLQAVKWLISKDLPVTANYIRSAHEFLFGEGFVTKLLDLSRLAETWLSSNQHKNVPISKEITTKIQNLHQRIDEFLSNAQTLIHQNQNQNQIQQQIPFQPEHFLDRMVKYIEQFQLNMTDRTDFLINENENTLKEVITQLLSHKNHLPEELVSRLEKIVDHILGQQLLITPDQGIFSQFILQFPSFVPFSTNPVFIQVHSKKEEGRAINPKDVHFAFLFGLNHLGELVVHLHILQKQIFVQIQNDYPLIKELVRELEPNFLAFIKEQGYQTSGITVQPFTKGEAKVDYPFSSFTHKGVDIKI
ncbi:hypothetical protein [Tepidibacillus sp. HK-1]|uniref:hypothetical protein n=1 Tax=Tepidibacillus sp. HK-1 TaxID=1883407 RepID=UPI00085294A7|nr:hypothetical protein [Tepidibacillus sp. HK-1]GBF11654.1 hypothetical protein HK1_01692 [Tepidibacillus sp. HK-1]